MYIFSQFKSNFRILATSAMRHTNSVYLKPGDMASFEIQFIPKFEKLFNCTLKLLIADNPFESVVVINEQVLHKIIIYKFLFS